MLTFLFPPMITPLSITDLTPSSPSIPQDRQTQYRRLPRFSFCPTRLDCIPMGPVPYGPWSLGALFPMGPVPYGPCSLWALVPMSPGPYGPCSLWALVPRGPVPYGPCSLWALFPMGPGPYGPWSLGALVKMQLCHLMDTGTFESQAHLI
jgi:hypothetical protein